MEYVNCSNRFCDKRVNPATAYEVEYIVQPELYLEYYCDKFCYDVELHADDPEDDDNESIESE